MTDSMKRRARATEALAGDLAEVSAWINKSGHPRFQIKCVECRHSSGARWRSRSDGASRGQGSSAGFALDVWAHHLDKAHPGVVCPWSTHEARGRAWNSYKDQETELLRILGLVP